MSDAERLRPFIEGARQRERERAEQLAQRAARLREKLPDVVRVLRDQFGARRVVLFGSWARGRPREGSDVDLLVWGVPPQRWYAACGAVGRALDVFACDLVPGEKAGPQLLAWAQREGESLLG